jgi:general secretion pathway protein B
MSFILDALRKSEAERQRQDGPTLLEMRPSRPQRRVPVWVIALAALLLLNMAVLLWFLLRTPPEPAPAHAARVTPTAPASAPAPTQPSAALPAAAPPVFASSSPPAPLLTPSSSAPPSSLPPAASTSAAVPSAHPAAPAPAKPARPRLEPSDSAADLPDYSRVAAGMPALRLDLHSYSDQPQQRYALINMHKVQEGDTLPEGPRVVHILSDGVVLSYQGTEFVLGRN